MQQRAYGFITAPICARLKLQQPTQQLA